jgi:alcohol dehydrogenase (cytochrome c)
MTGTYDPVPDLIYWGVANAAPDYDASLRPGDNLYTNSVIALHADTGKLSWYFQYSPGDDHDWDAVQVPVLANLADGPNSQRVLLSANRNGFFYALERTTGTFLRATPFVKQTWAEKITAAGRPIRRPEATPSLQGVLIYPGSEGGTNWWPPTFDPVAQQLIVPVLEQPGLFFKSADSELSEKNALLGGSSSSVSHDRYSAIRALDPRTGELKWEHRSLDLHDRGHLCGLTSTAGRLVFGCDQSRIIALDVEDGRLLWSFDTGSNIFAPAVTYRVDKDQMVTIVAGSVVLTFALPQSVAAQPPAQHKASR